jgi:hypothetical protein
MKHAAMVLVMVSILLVVGSGVYPAETGEMTRVDLVIPEDIWARSLEAVGFADRQLGYTSDQMANYRGSRCILPVVESLFRDVTSVPRFTGRLGDLLLENPSDFANAAALGYSAVDAMGGRGIVPPTEKDDWGVDWIQKSTSLDNALAMLIDKSVPDDGKWRDVPGAVKQLVARVLIAEVECKPYFDEAVDGNLLKTYFGVTELDSIPRDELYEFVASPWNETELTVVPEESFDLIESHDKNYQGAGSVIFLTYVKAAIDEYKAAVDADEMVAQDVEGFAGCEIHTIAGPVAITGSGSDQRSGDYVLTVDLGGDDEYLGRTGSPNSFEKPISVVIDLGGNDAYDGGQDPGTLGCGLFGLGAIFDLGGNDTYACQESGIGCGWYGTGMVVDWGGDDVYTTQWAWGQASAHVGLGMLVDLGGNDEYTCATESQAYGSTYGVGLLVDTDGDDEYLARLDGNISETFSNHTVSFAQGTACGRRADFGDGHSLAGGVGELVDGGGNDTYVGGVYCQGAGYWWSIGALEDRDGDDSYTNDQYSLGSAPHFAIGCCVDFAGNDKYNIGNENLACQTQGVSRDGSIGVFIDGAGDDQYLHTNRCAGSGDLNSIALFWDRMGNDVYTCDRGAPYNADRSYGDATYYEPFRTFRDEVVTVGIFLDTGGVDSYVEIMPTDPETAAETPPLEFGENREWHQRDDARFRSFGMDVGRY